LKFSGNPGGYVPAQPLLKGLAPTPLEVPMARSMLSFTGLALSFVALAFAAGCTAEVTTEGGDGGGGGESKGDGGKGGGAASANACDTAGVTRSCAAPGDPPNLMEGSQLCMADDHDALHWSECTLAPPGASSTPLVLSFDGAPVEFRAGGASLFDLTGSMSVATDWPSAATPWLALDRNGNGSIDDGSELFGSATRLANGALADNGFQALRELDTDGDGRITPADPGFAKLSIWSDRDGDRLSSAGEIAPLASRRLLSIDLGYSLAGSRCDLRGNCEIERASFRFADETGAEHTGSIVDVHLKFQ
jgi:hypothetical protein